MFGLRFTGRIGMVLAAGLLVAACGSDSGGSNGSAAATSGASQSSPAGQTPSFPAVPDNAVMTLVTNEGTIEIAMDPAAPITDASMTYLAEGGYFDGTSCHRLTTAGLYVLQCGDPEGTGLGGPGYQIPDENLPAAAANNYPAGTVAMANAGPNTNGSQFFLVYENTTLSPNYTVWGTVTSGLDVVQRVAAAGVRGGGTDGPPALPVTIETATVAGS